MALAASPPLRRLPCLLLIVLLAMSAAVPRGGAAVLGLKAPFSPRDVLPILPRQVAWPVMNTLHSAVDLLPSFVAAVAPGAPSPAAWSGACFAENEAAIELTPGDRNGTEVGGAVLRLKTASAQSWTCMDLYVFATPYRITWDYYFAAREHTLEIKSWEEEAELEYVKQHGISVFLMPSGMLGTLLSLIDVLPLFSNTAWGQHSNLAFLEKHMGASFEKRSQPWVANIRKEDIQSGDFLALSKIRGRWGGFETLEKWVTGAFAGHTSVCLKDEKGDLWVAESGYENEKVMAVMSMWTRLQPLYAANMWNEALNKRVGTEGLDLQGIIMETERRGMSFDQLLTIPEQDEWVYSDGKSTTCVAFILAMYKEAGMFAPFSESIQVTEFTIRDAYMLKIFEDNQARLPSWCNTESDKLPFCQILGEYRMELPEYNTIEPYAKMNENCPSLPPTYKRPSRC
ncbi:uncharacterized protein LOC133901331 isoform X2 [Phragmites australis]|uniref:uncharacterized protein LOC133901331 isoform X2 n=1 Tax=Phragmites australis TaxID=29695 RepID=UPI002D7881BF|nr:uncharacterized protein LOC133901331 isoform X2 [Phragmites australis]